MFPSGATVFRCRRHHFLPIRSRTALNDAPCGCFFPEQADWRSNSEIFYKANPATVLKTEGLYVTIYSKKVCT